MARIALLAVALFVAPGLVHAHILTTDKPVYQAGVPGPVLIRFTNETPLDLYLPGSTPWKIMKGNQVVFEPTAVMYPPGYLAPAVLKPGQTVTFIWFKSNQQWQYVAPGSYTVVVGPVTTSAGEDKDFFLTIALTPSGRIAGWNRFPLAVGNTWFYALQGETLNPVLVPKTRTMRVTAKSAQGWFKVKGLIQDTRWVRMANMNTSLRIGWLGGSGTWLAANLFHFTKPLNSAYFVEVPMQEETFSGALKVTALNEAVITPAGTFVGCYRLDLQNASAGDLTPVSFWFQPGMGMVQYAVSAWSGPPKKYRLHQATLRGSDGQVYTIGLK